MKRLLKDERLEQLVSTAITMAEETHYSALQIVDVAERAGCSTSLVRHYLGRVEHMRLAVLWVGVRRKNQHLIAQGRRAGLLTSTGRIRRCFREAVKNVS